MIEDYRRIFKGHLDREDREGAVGYALQLLQSGDLDTVMLYEQVIAYAVNNMSCSLDGTWCIWKEHVQTSIAATVVGCCFPYVMKERKERYGRADRGKAIIVCPQDEYHELGARMVSDFFTLCGYDVTFIGANTPTDQIANAVRFIRPKYVGVSVSNSYNLFAAARTIKAIRQCGEDVPRIVVGGSAFDSNPNIWKEIGADALARTFAEIASLE